MIKGQRLGEMLAIIVLAGLSIVFALASYCFSSSNNDSTKVYLAVSVVFLIGPPHCVDRRAV